MTATKNRIWRITVAAATGLVILFAADKISQTDRDTLISVANARIGRPLTPMSYAGVARRTTRRGAYVAGAAGAAAGYYGSGCYQTTDAYGRVYTQCP